MKLFFIISIPTLVLAGIIVYATDGYPAAIIIAPADIGGNAHIIWTRTVHRISAATVTYYKTMLSTATSTLAVTPALRAETRKKSIDALIEQTFIADAVKNSSASGAVEELLQKNIQAFAARSELNSAIMALYGLNGEDFIALVIRPEAEKEVLKQKNNWDDTALARWLAEEKEKAQIVRFLK